ncbi:hypothetical protein GCM10027168_50160 [Streptomyces capparidis]
MGGLGDGSGILEKAVALCRDLGDKRGEGVALTNLGTSRLQAGAPAEAARMLMRASDLLKEAGATHVQAKALMNLGKVWEVLGLTDRATEAVREAITLHRTARDRHGGRALFLLSSALWTTDPEEAVSLGTAAVIALGETDDEAPTEQATAFVATMRESIDGGGCQGVPEPFRRCNGASGAATGKARVTPPGAWVTCHACAASRPSDPT